MHAVMVTYRVVPERRDEFRRAMVAKAGQTLVLEPGCRGFDVWEHASEPEFYIRGTFGEPTDFDAHMSTSHYACFLAQTRAWITDRCVCREAQAA